MFLFVNPLSSPLLFGAEIKSREQFSWQPGFLFQIQTAHPHKPQQYIEK
jgi:hypothetical protein